MSKENITQHVDQIDQDKDIDTSCANMSLDTIKMEGLVKIQNGDTYIKTKNKFVQTTLQHIANMISGYGWYSGSNSAYFYGPLKIYSMYIGSNENVPTGYNTTALTAPIGGAPSSINVSTSNPSSGIFNMVITATWNANTVSGRLGEIALYLNMYPTGNLKPFRWVLTTVSNTSYTPNAAIMASRLAVADGAFTAFNIDTSKPLSIAWTIQLAFV